MKKNSNKICQPSRSCAIHNIQRGDIVPHIVFLPGLQNVDMHRSNIFSKRSLSLLSYFVLFSFNITLSSPFTSSLLVKEFWWKHMKSMLKGPGEYFFFVLTLQNSITQSAEWNDKGQMSGWHKMIHHGLISLFWSLWILMLEQFMPSFGYIDCSPQLQSKDSKGKCTTGLLSEYYIPEVP